MWRTDPPMRGYRKPAVLRVLDCGGEHQVFIRARHPCTQLTRMQGTALGPEVLVQFECLSDRRHAMEERVRKTHDLWHGARRHRAVSEFLLCGEVEHPEVA